MDASQEEWERKPGSGSDLRGQTDWGNISVRGQLALSGHWALGTSAGTCDPERQNGGMRNP
jgi:hypothetical protein